MGKTTRWLKSLFGIKSTNTKENERTKYSGHLRREPTGLCHNPATIPPNITPAEAAWLRSFYGGSDKEQNKHAIAVAAATAAAADAAVAAAQAAAAVVRLTSQGRGAAVLGGGREKWAATKIQIVFRGFLARKALRALKGLVKIQALVRGFLVRKQAAATLQGMQALIRAQASVRANKLRRLINNEDRFPPQEQARIPLNLKNFNINQQHKLEDERSGQSLHSRRLSASFDAAAVNPFEESPKIVEVDTGCRPKSRSRRANSWMAASGDPLLLSPSARMPLPDCRDYEECHFSTAQSTPRFASACGCSPARSVCAESYFGGNHPNYMAKTQSFTAKLRSHSAPKQRPEPGPKRRLSLHEMMESSRNSVSGVRMQRWGSQAQEAISFKNAVMGKFGRSSDYVRERENH